MIPTAPGSLREPAGPGPASLGGFKRLSTGGWPLAQKARRCGRETERNPIAPEPRSQRDCNSKMTPPHTQPISQLQIDLSNLLSVAVKLYFPPNRPTNVIDEWLNSGQSERRRAC